MTGKYGWDNFTVEELSCPCCGEFDGDVFAVDALQALRNAVGVPLTINSAYRCPEHNKAVGGVPDSHHVQGNAFDISIRSGKLKVDKWDLYQKAKGVGFTGFGFYKTFLHIDTGPNRTWGEW